MIYHYKIFTHIFLIKWLSPSQEDFTTSKNQEEPKVAQLWKYAVVHGISTRHENLLKDTEILSIYECAIESIPDNLEKFDCGFSEISFRQGVCNTLSLLGRKTTSLLVLVSTYKWIIISYVYFLSESPGWEDSLSHSELLDQYKRLKDLYDAEIKYLSNKEDALQLKNE